MYTITRQEAADILNISTRSIDRYIRAGKLRSMKDGKIIYINDKDIQNLKSGEAVVQEVIIPIRKETPDYQRTYSHQQDEVHYEKKDVGFTTKSLLEPIYEDLREDIKKKDDIIQTLSLRLWKAEEIAKNSVSLIDYKKSQFLLEESKWYLSSEVDSLKKEKEKLNKELKYEKNTNYIMLSFLIALLVLTAVIFFVKI